jgi:hypothetical protein
MSRRELLTEDEREQLFGVPVDEASLAKHYTLSPEDLERMLAKRVPITSCARRCSSHCCAIPVSDCATMSPLPMPC